MKHSNYIQLCPFMYTKRACVVFLRFQNSSRKIFYEMRSVVSIKDQREYYLFQDNFKNAKMMKIQQVHQKIHAKQFLIFYLYCFLLATHLNLMRLEKRD